MQGRRQEVSGKSLPPTQLHCKPKPDVKISLKIKKICVANSKNIYLLPFLSFFNRKSKYNNTYCCNNQPTVDFVMKLDIICLIMIVEDEEEKVEQYRSNASVLHRN